MSEDNLLGDYLRARRELVQPDHVGIPVNGVRRVNGLRREEVAMLAGISSDYYLRLEQGRDHNPSIQVLEALARVLQLDQTATDYLLGLVAPPPRQRRRRAKRESVPSGIQQLLDVVDLPAFVEGRYFDVLAANSIAYALSPNLQAGKNGQLLVVYHAQTGTATAEKLALLASLAHSTGTVASDLDSPRRS